MIERCRERKARRDPNGRFQRSRRIRCKARRGHRKNAAKALQKIEWRAPSQAFNLGEAEARMAANIMHALDAKKLKDCAEAFGAII